MPRFLLAHSCLLFSLTAIPALGQDSPPSLDSYDDPLPAGAVARLGTLRWRHDDGIGFAAFLPDGKSVISVGGEGTIRIWEFPTGKEKRRITLGPSANMFPQGFGGRYASNMTAALSKDGKVMATFLDNGIRTKNDNGPKIRLHDVASGKELSSLSAAGDMEIFSLVFSPNGEHLMSLSFEGPDNACMVRIWDWVNAKELRKFTAPRINENNFGRGFGGEADPLMQHSPDGNTLMVMDRTNALSFIDLRTGKEVGPGGHTSPLFRVRFSADGREVITQANDGTTRRWDAAGKDLGPVKMPGDPQQRFNGLNYGMNNVSPDGRIALLINRNAQGYVLNLVDTVTGKEISVLSTSGTGPYQPSLLFGPGNKLLALAYPNYPNKKVAATDPKIELYDVATGKLTRTLTYVQEPVKAGTKKVRQSQTVFFAPDGKTLAWSLDDKLVSFWDVATGQQTGSLALPINGTLQNPAFTPDGRCLALELNDFSISLYELVTGETRRVFGKPRSDKKGGAQIPGGGFFGGPGMVQTQAGSHIAISPNGKVLAQAGADKTLRLWDIATGREITAFPSHQGMINSLAFSPDSKMLASASADTTALLWDLAKAPPSKEPFTAAKAGNLDECWQTLANANGTKAFAAMIDMTATPAETVAFLKDKVKTPDPADLKRVEELIGQLDSDQYKVREAASKELNKFGEQIVPILDKALTRNPPLETKNRLEGLRGRLTGQLLQGDRLRIVRAVEVLERIGTPEARQLLQALADAAPGSLLSTSARAALER